MGRAVVGLCLAAALVGCGGAGQKAAGPAGPEQERTGQAGALPGGHEGTQAAGSPGTEADEVRVAALEKAINDTGEARHTCWAMAAADGFRVAGHVVLRLTFAGPDPEGGMRPGVEILADETGDERLLSCLRTLYEAYRWPAVFAPGQAVELPLEFVAPAARYTVALDHVEPVAAEGGKVSARLLLNEGNTGNGAASVNLVTFQPGVTLPLHRHSATAVVYVEQGRGLVFGLDGPKKGTPIGPGYGVYVPAGAPHGLRVVGDEPLSIVQLYTPAGPEQRARGKAGGTEPVSEKEVAEMRRDGGEMAGPMVVKEPRTYAIPGGSVAFYFDEAKTGHKAAYMGILTAGPGAKVPLHRHPGETELLFVKQGRGVMTVAGDTFLISPRTGVQVPANLEHSFEVTGDEAVVAIQFYTPAGPEQRFKKAP